VALWHEGAHWRRQQDRSGAQRNGRDEKRAYGDRGYQGCTGIIKAKAPAARDFTNRRVRKPTGEDEAERMRNRTK